MATVAKKVKLGKGKTAPVVELMVPADIETVRARLKNFDGFVVDAFAERAIRSARQNDKDKSTTPEHIKKMQGKVDAYNGEAGARGASAAKHTVDGLKTLLQKGVTFNRDQLLAALTDPAALEALLASAK